QPLLTATQFRYINHLGCHGSVAAETQLTAHHWPWVRRLISSCATEAEACLESLYLLRLLPLGFLSAAISSVLPRCVGQAQRRVVRRLTQSPGLVTEAEHSIKRLLIDWAANGLRTLVWVLYFIFLLILIPQTRTELVTVGDRLKAEFSALVLWLRHNG